METKPNDSATGYGIANNHSHVDYPGLTKREYFAAMAMQGLMVDYRNSISDEHDNAKYAVRAADALIKALNTK